MVDDRADCAASLADVLRLDGHQVRTESTGARALVRVREWRPDMVLLDIGLPDLDGYEVARRIRADHAFPIRLAAISGYGQPDDVSHAHDAGFDHHFIKPVDIQALLAWLRLEAAES